MDRVRLVALLGLCFVLVCPIATIASPRPDTETGVLTTGDLATIFTDPDRITLSLPSGEVSAVRRRSAIDGAGNLVWLGTIAEGRSAHGSGHVSITATNDLVRAHVTHGARSFGLEVPRSVVSATGASRAVDAAGSPMWRDVSPGAHPHHASCAFDTPPPAGEAMIPRDVGTNDAKPSGTKPSDTKPSDTKPSGTKPSGTKIGPAPSLPIVSSKASRIDVLVLYPPELSDQVAEVEAAALEGLGFANDFFANSGVPATYALVGVDPISAAGLDLTPNPTACAQFESACVVSRALAWIDDEPQEVVSLREQRGADMVVLYVPGNEERLCGKALLPVQRQFAGIWRDVPVRASNELFDTRAFTTIELHPPDSTTCLAGSYVLAHELGHNLGMFHVPAGLPSGLRPVHPGTGGITVATDDGPRPTLMDCVSDGCGQRLPCLSQARQNATCGDVTVTGALGNATTDNAGLAQQRAPIVAAYRPAGGGNAPPMITITEPMNGGLIQESTPVVLDASVTDPEDPPGSLNGSVTWRTDVDGFLGSGTPFQASFATPGPRVLTASVADSAGQVATHSVAITVTPPPIAPMTGLWWNPQRSGHGIHFVRNNAGDHVLTWYTYTSAGIPTWYQSLIGEIELGNRFEQDLYRYTPGPGGAIGTLVGSVELVFDGLDRATFNWQLGGDAGTEPFEHFLPASGRTGLWFPPDDVGWGLSLLQTGNTLVTTVYFYDAGEPRWVQGIATAQSQAQEIDVITVDGQGLCPGCGGGSAQPPPSSPAGTITLDIATDGAIEGVLGTNISSPDGTWSKPLQTIRKLAQ